MESMRRVRPNSNSCSRSHPARRAPVDRGRASLPESFQLRLSEAIICRGGMGVPYSAPGPCGPIQQGRPEDGPVRRLRTLFSGSLFQREASAIPGCGNPSHRAHLRYRDADEPALMSRCSTSNGGTPAPGRALPGGPLQVRAVGRGEGDTCPGRRGSPPTGIVHRDLTPAEDPSRGRRGPQGQRLRTCPSR